MIQGVVIRTDDYPHKDQYVGQVESLPNGKYLGWSEPVDMSKLFGEYSHALKWIHIVARRCGVEGNLRTPEHRMEV